MTAPGPRGGRAGRPVVVGLVGCLLVATLVTGCTTVRSDLGTSVSSCYLALPTATRAVDRHGHLLGVQRFTVGTLKQKAPALYGDLASHPPSSKGVCVVAFSGTFRASEVTDARGRPSGRLAVVVSTTPGNHVLGTVIFAHLPLRFGHTHAG